MFETEKQKLALVSIELSRWTHNLIENLEGNIKFLEEELTKARGEITRLQKTIAVIQTQPLDGQNDTYRQPPLTVNVKTDTNEAVTAEVVKQ